MVEISKERLTIDEIFLIASISWNFGLADFLMEVVATAVTPGSVGDIDAVKGRYYKSRSRKRHKKEGSASEAMNSVEFPKYWETEGPENVLPLQRWIS